MLSRPLLAATVALIGALPPVTAGAVIILDDTWSENGGTEDDPAAGFGPAIELAAEPQFAATLAIYREDGSQACTGTWLGNDENGHAFVLTAAHCFNSEPEIGTRFYRTDGGTELPDVARTIHPQYDANAADSSGYFDMAVVELDGPIEDSGDPPVLYSGSEEDGMTSTQVGYGTRGTGEHGQDDRFKSEEDTSKAAARNTISWVAENEEGGGWFLYVGLDKPDNDEGLPADELEGIGAQGDSGGPLWVETEDSWLLAGVYAMTANGDGASEGNPVYGDAGSYFSRVSTNLEFIQSVFPDVATSE